MAGFRGKYSQQCEATENLLFVIIMLLLIYKNLQCLCTAPFVLSVPLLPPACWLSVEHPLSPWEDISSKVAHTPSLLFLQKGPELFVVKWSHPSLQLSVTFMGTIGSSQSTPLKSIGTKITLFFHSSICWTQQIPCHYVCFKSKQSHFTHTPLPKHSLFRNVHGSFPPEEF